MTQITITRDTSFRSIRTILIRILFVCASLWIFYLADDPRAALTVIISGFLCYLVIARKLDYLDPFVIFSIPWIVIIAFSLIPMSGYAIPIHRNTYELILLILLGALVTASVDNPNKLADLYWPRASKSRRKPDLAIYFLDFTLVALTVTNVVLAGYVPLIRGILTGDTGYLEFGIHGLFGFYLAFANAWAIFHLVLYLRTKQLRYLFRFASVFVIFIFFVTRQNLISVMVEGLIVYSILRRRVSLGAIGIILVIAGIVFSLIGSFRSGNIRQVAAIRPQYYWVPEPVIWLYCYSYFNVANVDNLLYFNKTPSYDGASLTQLIPSFLRPAYESRSFIEVASFNVSSYLSPVYHDAGTAGVLLLTVTALWVTQRLRASLYREASLYKIGTFATLYFCAAFSFFVNFWFYLPIVFQIVFFRLLSRLADRVVSQETATDERLQPRRSSGDTGEALPSTTA